MLANFHQVEAALLFNSGYDANLGFFASVPQRGDLVLYDEFSHASIRDGITLGNAKAQKFGHNNLNDLSLKLEKLKRAVPSDAEVYVVTESVFSMDGDSPDFEAMVHFCEKNDLRLVIDEAHALGTEQPVPRCCRSCLEHEFVWVLRSWLVLTSGAAATRGRRGRRRRKSIRRACDSPRANEGGRGQPRSSAGATQARWPRLRVLPCAGSASRRRPCRCRSSGSQEEPVGDRRAWALGHCDRGVGAGSSV